RGATAFRAFRAELRDALPRQGGGALCLDVLLGRCTREISYVPVDPGRRRSGRSNYSVVGLVTQSLALLLQGTPRRWAGAAMVAWWAMLLFAWGAWSYPLAAWAGAAVLPAGALALYPSRGSASPLRVRATVGGAAPVESLHG
ncbi:MAG: hypothetical protein ICV87_00755, partial [Gemmatimonadetes bacterium]|nr:hypothetical protein [Gemmatimonadota bacterium]